MASTINATTASGGGVITTADATGLLNIQTNGTTAIAIDGSQNVVVTGTLSATGGVQGTLGVGQVWTNVTGSRALATTYTNSTGKPIQVVVSASDSTVNQVMTIYVSGVLIFQQLATSGYTYPAGCVIVPNGATYTVSLASGTLVCWAELR